MRTPAIPHTPPPPPSTHSPPPHGAGIPTVSRAVITELTGDDLARERKRAPIAREAAGAKRYKLLVEGTNLLSVLGTPGVAPRFSRTNSVMELAGVLGIEAARRVVMVELNETYKGYGIAIDPRHLQLLADAMTFRGEVSGWGRGGGDGSSCRVRRSCGCGCSCRVARTGSQVVHSPPRSPPPLPPARCWASRGSASPK
jgi:hypothetical protein